MSEERGEINSKRAKKRRNNSYKQKFILHCIRNAASCIGARLCVGRTPVDEIRETHVADILINSILHLYRIKETEYIPWWIRNTYQIVYGVGHRYSPHNKTDICKI